MVNNLRILLCVVFVTVSSVLSAQVNEVTLVASGEGQTKPDAVNNALRSAIEQAYGVFVSANTDILNDELVKDEIVTVSSGNIHSYKELGCADLTNGNKSVSIEAVVSISNLVNFAQSKGAACEFAGAVFGANLKLINLNKSNGVKAMENLYLTLENVGKTMYDYELEVGEPKADGKIDITVVAKANANYKVFTDLVYNTLKSLSVTNVEQLKSMGIKYYSATVVRFDVIDDLTLNKDMWNPDRTDIGSKWTLTDKVSTLFDIKYSVNRIKEIQNAAFLSFVVRDSNAKEYIFDGNLPGCYMNYSYHSDEKECHSILVEPEVFREKYGMAENWSTEIFDYDSCPATARMFSWVGTKYLVAIPNLRVNQTAVKCTKTFTLPVEELMTISGFAIERKN